MESSLDRMAALGAALLGAPIGLVCVPDGEWLRFVGRYGTALEGVPAGSALCAAAVGATAPVRVADASADPDTREDPLVASALAGRYFFGVPLVPAGAAGQGDPGPATVGALCVLDPVPRPESGEPGEPGEPLEALERLAALVREEVARAARSPGRRPADPFRAVFERAPVGIALLEPATGTVREVNERFAEIVGAPIDELVGTRWPEASAGPPTAALPAVGGPPGMASVLGPAGRQTWRYRRRDGSGVWVDTASVALDEGGDEAPRQLVVMQDVTERHHAEEALADSETERADMQDRLARSERLESIGQLAGGVAHDFNNLLTVILGSAELLIEELSGQPEPLSLLEMVHSAAERGVDLTARLTAFARRQTLEPRVIDPVATIESLQGLLRHTLPATIQLDTTACASQGATLLDPGQFEAALLNLVINARDAMRNGGVLRIATADVEVTEPGEVVEPGAYVAVAVSDTGDGMPPEVLDRAFDPFYSTKEGRGSGLGLSMVHGFIRQSGGSVDLDSVPGRGTTVTMYLPRAAQEAVEAAGVAGEPAVVGGDERVLVVEDDEDVRTHAARMLRDLGYRVIEAGSGLEALAVLEGDEPVDLLFTDVVMPDGVSGLDLAQRARLVRPGLRVLYTSGYADHPMMGGDGERLGVSLLRKPYQRRRLAQRIREALDA